MLNGVSYKLSVLKDHGDLNNPEDAAKYIANLPVANSYKETFVKAYNYYVEVR